MGRLSIVSRFSGGVSCFGDGWMCGGRFLVVRSGIGTIFVLGCILMSFCFHARLLCRVMISFCVPFELSC